MNYKDVHLLPISQRCQVEIQYLRPHCVHRCPCVEMASPMVCMIQGKGKITFYWEPYIWLIPPTGCWCCVLVYSCQGWAWPHLDRSFPSSNHRDPCSRPLFLSTNHRDPSYFHRSIHQSQRFFVTPNKHRDNYLHPSIPSANRRSLFMPIDSIHQSQRSSLTTIDPPHQSLRNSLKPNYYSFHQSQRFSLTPVDHLHQSLRSSLKPSYSLHQLQRPGWQSPLEAKQRGRLTGKAPRHIWEV